MHRPPWNQALFCRKCCQVACSLTNPLRPQQTYTRTVKKWPAACVKAYPRAQFACGWWALWNARSNTQYYPNPGSYWQCLLNVNKGSPTGRPSVYSRWYARMFIKHMSHTHTCHGQARCPPCLTEQMVSQLHYHAARQCLRKDYCRMPPCTNE